MKNWNCTYLLIKALLIFKLTPVSFWSKLQHKNASLLRAQQNRVSFHHTLIAQLSTQNARKMNYGCFSPVKPTWSHDQNYLCYLGDGGGCKTQIVCGIFVCTEQHTHDFKAYLLVSRVISVHGGHISHHKFLYKLKGVATVSTRVGIHA